MIEDNLRAVHKIAELRLPDRQLFRIGDALAEFETERTVFGQEAVHDFALGLGVRKMIEGIVFLPRLNVVKDRMAVGESSPLRILSG